MHSATCGLGKENKKKKEKKKKRQWQTGYSLRPPTSPYRSQSLHAGWPPVCSSIFQILLKSVQWFCRCGWSKIALPLTLAIGLLSILYRYEQSDIYSVEYWRDPEIWVMGHSRLLTMALLDRSHIRLSIGIPQ